MKPDNMKTDTSRIVRSLRDNAEKQLAQSLKNLPDLKGQPAEKLIHELQVHQIELETQAEELRRVQSALEESRDKYIDLYEFAPVGYLTLSDKALIEEVNLKGATLLGIERGILINARFRKFIAPESLEQWDRYFINVLNQGEKQSCPIQLVRGDGTTFPAQLESLRISNSSKEDPKVRVTISDITYIHQAEMALRISNKKLNLLSSITRHDILNELMVLSGSLELAIKTMKGQAGIDHIKRAQKAADTIQHQIAFTKVYEQIGVNAPIWQNCHRLIETAVKEVNLEQIIVKNDFPAGTEIFADPLVVKVFFNLVDNAVRYGGKISAIRFTVLERNGNHVVVCEDDGDGILASEKEQIFKRGFGKNHGLGLSLSREILEITGITIHETGEPGKGARFEMTVPKSAYRVVPGIH
ncbi:MAG: PAS domain-containing sensor histidine kinase [Methanoregula sp.]